MRFWKQWLISYEGLSFRVKGHGVESGPRLPQWKTELEVRKRRQSCFISGSLRRQSCSTNTYRLVARGNNHACPPAPHFAFIEICFEFTTDGNCANTCKSDF